MRKSEYLAVLKEHKLITKPGKSVEADPVEAVPVVEAAVSTPETPPAPAEPVAVEREVPRETTTTAETPAQTTEQPATPVAEPELFKGESTLDPDIRKQIREQFEAAKAAKQLEDDLKKTKHEYGMVTGRLAPTQRALSNAQLEATRLQQELNKIKAAQGTQSSSALKQRIEAMKSQFPEDAQMWEGTLAAIEAANQRSADLEARLAELNQKEFVNEQVSELTAAHPDWRKRGARIAQDGAGNYLVQPTVDTPEAQEFTAWANGLDPHERQVLWPLISSPKAADAIYLLNRFQHDRNIAWQAYQATQQQQSQASTATPPANAAPVPVPDPDPTRRTVAPVTQRSAQTAPAGHQPVSEKHAEFLQAAKVWEELQKQRAKRSVLARRAN